MFDATTIGKWIIVAGLVVVLVGGAIWLVGRLGLPVGRLPGDLRIEGKNFSVYIPIATSIIFSLVLTVVLNLIARFWRK